MQTLGITIIIIAILAGLVAWGFRQWQRGHLAHVPFLPKPPAAPAQPPTEPKP